MELTQHELNAMLEEVDHTHHEGMRHFSEEVAELHLDAAQANRKRFLAGTGAIGVGAIAGTMLLTRGFASASAAGALDDQTIAGYAQGIELAAVAAYTMAAPVLSPGTLKVAKLFISHHQQHADAFGSVAGNKKATGPNAKLVAALTPTLKGIKDEKAALEFAFTLENQAAYTYAAALTLLQDPTYAAATATILPIETAHAVVLGLALGKPVTDVFPTKAFESANLGDGTDPLAGLDPAKFA
jgi:rubrerythrin